MLEPVRASSENTDLQLLLVTVATDTSTDGYIRFMKSTNRFGLEVKV